MTEKTTKALIGAFVLGAVALLAAGVTLMGSGMLFQRTVSFVLYFDASLRGLVVGAPVYFKGIRLGKVTSIQISMGAEDEVFRTPVIIELESDLVSRVGQDDPYGAGLLSQPAVVDELISRGLRARLGMQSFITGQLTVELDMFPDAPFVNPSELLPYRGIAQIPTLPSALDKVLAEARQIPIQEIAHSALHSLRAINRQLEGLDLPGLVASMKAASEEIRRQSAGGTAIREKVMATMDEYSLLASDSRRELGKTLAEANIALKDLSRLSRSADKAVESAGQLLREDSAPILEFSQTLQSLREAAAALTNLAVLLELKPDSLLFGRGR